MTDRVMDDTAGCLQIWENKTKIP